MKKVIYPAIALIMTVFAHAQSLSPKVTPTSGGYYTGGGKSLSWTMGETYNTTLSSANNKLTLGFQQPEINVGVILNLVLFIQGFYQGGGMMTQVLYNEGIDLNPFSVNADTVTVSLIDSVLLANDPNDNSTGADIVAISKGVLKTNGSLAVIFPGIAVGHKYYLRVTHRNAVETWSANTVTITNGGLYNFTADAANAYGNNEVNNGDDTYAFYSGDLNHDGGIDGFDFLILYPDIIAGNGGYLSTDLTGDGGVDGFDFLVLYPNIIAGAGSSHP